MYKYFLHCAHFIQQWKILKIEGKTKHLREVLISYYFSKKTTGYNHCLLIVETQYQKHNFVNVFNVSKVVIFLWMTKNYQSTKKFWRLRFGWKFISNTLRIGGIIKCYPNENCCMPHKLNYNPKQIKKSWYKFVTIYEHIRSTWELLLQLCLINQMLYQIAACFDRCRITCPATAKRFQEIQETGAINTSYQSIRTVF